MMSDNPLNICYFNLYFSIKYLFCTRILRQRIQQLDTWNQQKSLGNFRKTKFKPQTWFPNSYKFQQHNFHFVPPWRFFYWILVVPFTFPCTCSSYQNTSAIIHDFPKSCIKKFKENVPLTVVPKAFHKHVLNFHYS
jgi:hypothetical protein